MVPKYNNVNRSMFMPMSLLRNIFGDLHEKKKKVYFQLNLKIYNNLEVNPNSIFLENLKN